jgi:FMN-dependent NADH-azoreductase
VAGRSFRYTENGPEGLLGGKRVIIAFASGGVYTDDNPYEHARSYLKIFFNFLGIEPEFVNAGGVAMGLDEAIAGAGREIELLAA